MTLVDDLKLLEEGVEKPNPFTRYYLLENPFPSYGDTQEDVCTNQQAIKQEFLDTLRNFDTQAKRLRINGESGAGKTNILRYFERLTEEARRRGLIDAIFAIYISAPEDNYFAIHEQIVDQLMELFLGDLIVTLETESGLIDKLTEEIKPAIEILMALKPIVRPNMLFDPFKERRIDTFGRWLKGRKLTVQEKKDLGGGTLPDIKSASLAIRFLDGFLRIFKEVRLCKGIVLLFDEFEEIFEGLSRTRHSRYAQDLRHLFDTLQASTFFVVGTIAEPKDLAQYPAIVRRLGEPLYLEPITDVELAITYVQDYLYYGHKRYFEIQDEQLDESLMGSLEPLSRDLVSQEYERLRYEAETAGLSVLPGYFLPRMRQLIQNIVEGNSI